MPFGADTPTPEFVGNSRVRGARSPPGTPRDPTTPSRAHLGPAAGHTDPPADFARAKWRSVPPAGLLHGNALGLSLTLYQAPQGFHYLVLLGLLHRKGLGNHRDCRGWTGFGTGTASNALFRINDAVLCISRSGWADIETQAVLGAQAKISHRVFFSHHQALPSTFSNFQLGTLHTGQRSGAAFPT